MDIKALVDMAEDAKKGKDTGCTMDFGIRLQEIKKRNRKNDEIHRKNMDRIDREYLLSTSRLYKELGE